MEKWPNMNTSFSKESLSLLMNQEPSTPTKLADWSPSQSEHCQVEISPNLHSFPIGKLEPTNVLINGGPPSFPLKEPVSVRLISLQSKVEPEKLESLPPPPRRVLKIAYSDIKLIASILHHSLYDLEQCAINIKST